MTELMRLSLENFLSCFLLVTIESHMTDVPIIPNTISINRTFSDVKIVSVSVTPFVSATINCLLYFTDSSGGTPLDPGVGPISTSILMTGTAYEAWSQNDQYLVDYVLSQLGFAQQPGSQVKVSTVNRPPELTPNTAGGSYLYKTFFG
jgi:hypothetical protein